VPRSLSPVPGRPRAVALVLLGACARKPPAPAVFQPTLAAATAVAQQRYAGDLVVFLSDGSPSCRQARAR
jgi:hypothetical protein